jgi:hypothetical protein
MYQANALAVRDLSRQPGLRAQVSAASRARALQEYAWPVVVKRQEALWRELEARRPRRGAPRPRFAVSALELFAGYPSGLLSPTTKVRRRVRAAQGAHELPSYPGSRDAFDEDEEIAAKLWSMLARGPSSARELAPRVGQAESAVIRHLLRLIKHGFVQPEAWS